MSIISSYHLCPLSSISIIYPYRSESLLTFSLSCISSSILIILHSFLLTWTPDTIYIILHFQHLFLSSWTFGTIHNILYAKHPSPVVCTSIFLQAHHLDSLYSFIIQTYHLYSPSCSTSISTIYSSIYLHCSAFSGFILIILHFALYPHCSDSLPSILIVLHFQLYHINSTFLASSSLF